jgi:hypothetical protein
VLSITKTGRDAARLQDLSSKTANGSLPWPWMRYSVAPGSRYPRQHRRIHGLLARPAPARMVHARGRTIGVRYIFSGMITIKMIAETIEAARRHALPGREASAVSDVMSSIFARRLRSDRRQRWFSQPENRRRHRHFGDARLTWGGSRQYRGGETVPQRCPVPAQILGPQGHLGSPQCR